MKISFKELIFYLSVPVPDPFFPFPGIPGNIPVWSNPNCEKKERNEKSRHVVACKRKKCSWVCFSRKSLKLIRALFLIIRVAMKAKLNEGTFNSSLIIQPRILQLDFWPRFLQLFESPKYDITFASSSDGFVSSNHSHEHLFHVLWVWWEKNAHIQRLNTQIIKESEHDNDKAKDCVK